MTAISWAGLKRLLNWTFFKNTNWIFKSKIQNRISLLCMICKSNKGFRSKPYKKKSLTYRTQQNRPDSRAWHCQWIYLPCEKSWFSIFRSLEPLRICRLLVWTQLLVWQIEKKLWMPFFQHQNILKILFLEPSMRVIFKSFRGLGIDSRELLKQWVAQNSTTTVRYLKMSSLSR